MATQRCPVKLVLRKVFCPWPSVHNVLIILSVLFLLSLVDLTAGEWASWVQAFGSIAAILGAFALSGRQLAKHDAERTRQERKKMHAYIAVINHAVEQCQQALISEQEETTRGNIVAAWAGGYAQTFNSSLASLELLATHELGDRDLVVAYNCILGEMTNIATYIAQYSLLDEPDEDEGDLFLARLRSSVAIIDINWCEFERYTDSNPPS